MELNDKGEVIKLTWQESEMRESYLRLLSLDAQLNRLKQERQNEQEKFNGFCREGLELYLFEVDKHKIKMGWF